MNLKSNLLQSLSSVAVLAIMLASCSSSEFAGSSKKAAPAKTKTSTSSNSKPTNTTPPEAEHPEVITTTESKDNSTSSDNLKTDQGSTAVTVGGSNQIYHIGDGHFTSNSACYSELVSQSYQGTVYRFKFVITQPNTKVSISINKICGVDLLLNTVTLVGSQIPSKYLSPQSTSMAVISNTTLNQGEYVLEVRSTNNNAGTSFQANNYDNFLVGQVQISADKPALRDGGVSSAN